MNKLVKDKQEDFFLNADLGWFHIFTEMISSGDLKLLMKECKSSIGVYLVIKSLVHYKKGVSFPSIATIIDKTGLTNKTVIKALEALEKYDYIDVDRTGKNNVYRVREKIRVRDKNKEDVALVTFDYFSSVLNDVRNEIKKFIMSPNDDKSYQFIQIENLNINLNQQINNGEGGVQYNQPVQSASLGDTSNDENEQIQNWLDGGKSWLEIQRLYKVKFR